MKSIAIAVLCLLCAAGCGDTDTQVTLELSELFALQQYVITNGRPPVEYVVGKFVDHDVVFLGETHWIRHDPLLVQALIPELHAHGIYVLATEFANAVDQPLIDSLLSGETYDEALVRHIQMNHYSEWPCQEYLDIFKSAWQLNRSLSAGTRPFRIIAVNCLLDWTPVVTKDDVDNPDKRALVWKDCSEKDWANVVLAHVNAGDKVLAYCGMHHAFTRYRQPIVDEDGNFIRFGDIRFGNWVREAIGDRAFTVHLHHPSFPRENAYGGDHQRPAAGIIDHVMESLDPQYRPLGFDIAGSPFAALGDSNALYCAGYDTLTLDQYCDGWIYQAPWSEIEIVTFAEGFYTDDNIELARVRTSTVSRRHASPAEFEADMRKELQRRLAKFRELTRRDGLLLKPNQAHGRPRPIRPLRMLISLLLTILVAAAILLAAFYFYQHKLIFMPTSALEATPAEAGFAYEDIRVTVNTGELVHAWYMPARDSAAPVIMFSHGNAGNISHRLETARFLHDLGAAVLMYDYRGYGLSEGSPSESNLYADAAAVYDWLTRTKGIPANRVFLMGRSLGGAVAVDLATRAACAGLIVESSFTSVPEMGKRLYPWLPIDWLARYRFDSETKIGSVPCPVLVLHSVDDEMIPFEMGQRLYAAAPEPKRFIQLRGGHNDLGHFNSAIYVNGLREFLGLAAGGGSAVGEGPAQTH